ncbi:MAG: hypothetical protein ACYDHP_13810 [Ferrimicrobium sp.]
MAIGVLRERRSGGLGTQSVERSEVHRVGGSLSAQRYFHYEVTAGRIVVVDCSVASLQLGLSAAKSARTDKLRTSPWQALCVCFV